jgi:hypothetical protein
MRSVLPAAAWVTLLLLGWPGSARAEWQIRPGVGVSFAQNTTFTAPDASGSVAKFGFGVTGALVGNIFGVEADLGRRSGFFPSSKPGNVLSSSVTTLTGNVTVALPRRLVEYTLRPYFVGGAGLMAVRIDEFVNFFDVSSSLGTIDIGGGVTGFLTDRIGLNWDVRRFRSIGEGQGPQLSYWRANMALAIRY